MGNYLKACAGDFVLTAAVAMALSYIALDGFYVSPALQYGPAPALVALACCAVLFVVARNARSARIGGVAYAACLVVAWVVAGALTPGGRVFEDDESNYLIFAMCTTLVPTLCFLVTRKRAGAAALFVAGVLFCAVIQLLYQHFDLAWVLVFSIGSLALVMFKNYQLSLRTASSVHGAAMLPGFAVALGVAALAAALAALGWFGVIAPAHPDAVHIKLITEYRALETRQVVGTSSVFQTPNTDMTSNITNDATRTTDDIQESLDGTPWPATGEEEEPDDQQQESTFLGVNMDSLQDAFDFQQNPGVLPLMLGIIAFIVALIAAYFVGRRIWRARRLQRLRGLGAAAEYENVFLLLLKYFGRIGIAVPAGQTLVEFGKSSAGVMSAYNEQSGVQFGDLAAEYCAITYGNAEVSGESVGKLERFYNAFWKACRQELGNLKYFFKSFRL